MGETLVDRLKERSGAIRVSLPLTATILMEAAKRIEELEARLTYMRSQASFAMERLENIVEDQWPPHST